MFKGILIDKADGNYSARLTDIEESALPEGDVTVDVQFSSLNYKDALAITGKSPVVRRFPMVPGIDLVGTVSASEHAELSVGTPVVLNGWGVGESHWGGLAARARVKGDWLVRLPAAFDTSQAMAVGTAGYTAMLCVLALEEGGVRSDAGEILVTGASGGVGSVALALLAARGYPAVALTGRPAEEPYLRELGASAILERAAYAEPGKPLAKERWAGVIDAAGSHVLANALAATKYGGTVAACGLAAGMDLPATVAPFLLRGVRLVGVDSVYAPRELRQRAWDRLATDLDAAKLAAMSRTIPLAEAIPAATEILAGRVRGRLVVDVRA